VSYAEATWPEFLVWAFSDPDDWYEALAVLLAERSPA
jgi:hypothetical protein